MKIKTFEKYVKLDKLVDLSKIKKYVIYHQEDEYFLDEIIKIEKNNDNIVIKNISFFLVEFDSLMEHNNDVEEVFFSYLDDVEFSSDDYEEIEKYFMNIVDMYRTSKKYNL